MMGAVAGYAHAVGTIYVRGATYAAEVRDRRTWGLK